MMLTEQIDNYLLYKWEWSSNLKEEKFWLDVTKDFLLFLRSEKIKQRNLCNHPIWNSYFDMIKTFDF